MFATKAYAGNRPMRLGYFCGLGMIAAAAVLNVVHDRFAGQDGGLALKALTDLYATLGKFNVTLLLATLGLGIILLSNALRRPARTATAAGNGQAVPGIPYFYAPPNDPPGSVHVHGGVVLQTRKYLPRPNRSGTTGMPPPRVPVS